MKKIILALSFAFLQAPIFSAQEVFPESQLQEQDITPEHFEKKLRHPVTREETEKHILFFGVLKECKIRVSLAKATGAIEIDDIITTHNGYGFWLGGELMCMMEKPRFSSFRLSLYNNYPRVTYNALQALYEKQQRDAREQAEKCEQEENKQEEEQENQEVQE